MPPATPFSTKVRPTSALGGRRVSLTAKQEVSHMVRLSDISKGEARELDRILEANGFDGDLARSIIRDGTIARVMVDAAKTYLADEELPAGTVADEEIVSSFGYPPGWKMKTPAKQAKTLLHHFPGLDLSYLDELVSRYETRDVNTGSGTYRTAPKMDRRLVLPPGMDGLAVIPKPSWIAKTIDGDKDWPSYNKAVRALLVLMKKAYRDFTDCTEGKVGPNYLRLNAKTAEVYAKLAAEMPGDVLVIPVQTGLLHRGKFHRQVRAIFKKLEFGLDVFTTGIILLTHPDRLTDESLWIHCAGSDFAPDGDSDFHVAPYWEFNKKLVLDWRKIHALCRNSFGSASGQLPECES